jgi:hypothetical protein
MASALAAARQERPRSLADRRAMLARRLVDLDAAARRFDVLLDCTSAFPVDQAGDRRHRWGFHYDERDGTGIDRRPALVRHRGGGSSDLRFLRLARTKRCLSAAPDPNGTGEAARSLRANPSLDHLEALAAQVERRTERFDEWESCLSWVPVTEAGDHDQDLGYLRQLGTSRARRHDPAIDVDASEWDDPDYQLAAFAGRDHPFGPDECDTEPGEEGFRLPPRRLTTAMASATASPSSSAVGGRIERLAETVEDLGEPVQEITQFDECMYTVGVQERAGYVYETRRGSRRGRPALSFDMRGPSPAQFDLMAFPGEEPPQIECNEDASGEGTEE